MQELRLRCNAKLNLSLDVTGVRPDGYHEMDMVMQSVNLFDSMTVRRVPGIDVKVETNLRYIPTDERNLVYKTAVCLAERYGVAERGLEVHIKKNIPTQAGLGGGSADAAGMLLALKKLWRLPMDESELIEFGLSIGADTPFCTFGGTMRVGGIGEELRRLPHLVGCHFVIAMPPFGTKTKEAFAAIDERTDYRRPDTDALIEALRLRDIGGAAKEMVNVFETSGTSETAAPLMAFLRENGALGASLTGTGAAVFGVFASRRAAERCKEALGGFRHFSKPVRAYTARPVNRGIYIENNRRGDSEGERHA